MAESNPEKSDHLSTRLRENYLQCSICLEQYNEPKVLNCLHSFCVRCLERHVAGASTIRCPNCNQEMPTPENGVGDLKTNFFIKGINDEIAKEKQLGDKKKEEKLPCSCCDVETVPKFTCSDCGGVLCDECESQHNKMKIMKNHNVKPLDSTEITLKEIDEKFASMKGNSDKLRSRIKDLTDKIAVVEDDRDKTIRQIDSSKEAFLNVVDNYVKKLKKEVLENAEKRMGNMKQTLELCKAKVQDFDTAKEQQKIICGLDLEDKTTLCKQLVEQLNDIQKKQIGIAVVKSHLEKKKEFVMSNEDGYNMKTACARFVGFLHSAESMWHRDVEILWNDGMKKMKKHAVDCAQEMFENYGSQPRNVDTFNAMADFVCRKFERKYTHTDWNCIVATNDDGVGWQLHSERLIRVLIEGLYITIFEP